MQVLRPDTSQTLREEPRDPAEAIAPSLLPSEEPDAPSYALVVVEWHDAWFDEAQSTPDDFRDDYLVRTVGFLIADGPSVVTVAHEVLPDGDGFRAVTHIPLAIVERIHRLSPLEAL
jgi:hypothetical protein